MTSQDFRKKIHRTYRRALKKAGELGKTVRYAWFDLDKKKAMYVAAVVIAVGLITAIVVVAASDRRKKAEENAVHEEPVAELPVETKEAHEVVPLSPDGPVFPELDVQIPTTEPAPEYIYPGTESWIVADIQQRLMDLGFMDSDEPTTYYGDGTQSSVKLFQRQHDLVQDGIMGPDTITLLFSDDAKYYAAKEGDSGPDISSIQNRLYQMGYLAFEDLITGNFGEKTKQAVEKLQEINGLAIDGTVGRETYNLIYSDEVKANFLTFGEQSDVVLAAQKRLFALGYMASAPDGTYGKDTYDAIFKFQQKNALVADGYLGPETRYFLMSDQALPNHLGIGDQNDQVRRVQERLVELKYLSSGRATGYFGEITQKAVKNFQSRNGIGKDGLVGPATSAKLFSENAKKAASGMLDGANFKTTGSSGGSAGGGNGAGTSGGSAGTGSGAGASGGSAGGGSGTGTAGSGADAGSSQQIISSGTVPNTDANGVSESVANLLSVARSKLGAPYVWGSKGPNSFDCSGFVHWCLNQCGVSQSYVTSSGWRNVGRYTRIGSYMDLRAGDIIVVNGHVGIISTGGYLIDASSSNGRVIERPLGSWWANHFITGWRIF